MFAFKVFYIFTIQKENHMRTLVLLFFFFLVSTFTFSQTDSATVENNQAVLPAVTNDSAQRFRNTRDSSISRISGQAGKYTLVERNRNAAILIFGNEIQQGEKIIGTYEEKISKDEKTRNIFIYLFNGPRVAEATCEGENCHAWAIVTLKDKMNHTVVSKPGSDRKDVIIYLIRTYYL